jgi:hypothetical protein
VSLLKNDDWNKPLRVIGKSSVIVRINDVRETIGEQKDGKPARDMTWIAFRTEAPTKTVDGEELPAGFPVEVALGTYSDVASIADPGERDKATKANEISQRTFRSLVLACLRLPQSTKNAAEELQKQGGVEALKGKQVVADLSASSQGMQNVNRFSAVPEGAVSQATSNNPY